MKKVAVVLLNFNGLSLLKKYLPSVSAFSPQAALYLIDNGSSDASVAWVTAQYPKIKCISLPKNRGYAGGYNEGLQHINEEIYCLLNTDVRVKEHWLVPILNHFDTNPKTAIAQPHILDDKNPNAFEYAGAAGGVLDRLGIPFCRGRIFSSIEEDQGQYDATQAVFWASGACFFIRKSVFWELGGFDARFFAHQEEIDLCWRAFNKGHATVAIGESKVYHLGGGTLQPSPKKVFLNYRNSLCMLYKNLPEKVKTKVLFERMLWDGLAGLHFLIQFQFLNTWAIIRAHFAFYALLESLKNNPIEGDKKHDYYHSVNVIAAFYFFRRLNFRDIVKNKNNFS